MWRASNQLEQKWIVVIVVEAPSALSSMASTSVALDLCAGHRSSLNNIRPGVHP